MKKILLTYLLAFFYITIYSQINNKGEIQTYSFQNNKNIFFEIDTSLKNFEEYNFWHSENWEYFNLGNIGSAEQNLSFSWTMKKGFNHGNIFFDNYKYTFNKIKRYQFSKYPFSELSYSIGTNLEQIARLKHAQNIKNRFQFAVDVYGISGKGAYDENQRSRNVALSFYGLYSSKNNRYHLGTDFTYSTIKTKEIGGIQENVLTDIRETKQFYTTYLNEAQNKQKDLRLALKNDYSFGFFNNDSIYDSLEMRIFHPIFKINHSIGIEKVNNEFLSKSTNDSIFFGDFFQSKDSTYNQLKYTKIPHKISLEYLGTIKSDTVKYRNLRAEISLEHNNYSISHYNDKLSTNNFIIDALAESNHLSGSKLSYRLNSYYILTGFNKGDFHLKAQSGYDFNKYGQLSASILYETIRPSWLETNYSSNKLSWNNSNFKNKQVFETNISYTLKKHKLKFEANLDLLKNYVYFNSSSSPTQTNGKITYWNISLLKNTKWKIWHWDNFIGFQSSNYPEIIPLPKLFLKTSFYAEFRIFKKDLLLNTGFDLRYNTPFKARAWNPVISQFYIQNSETMKYTPIVDVFLNAKIKSVRIYLKLNYINEDLFVQNYYKALNFPSRGRSFSFGASWRFFE